MNDIVKSDPYRNTEYDGLVNIFKDMIEDKSVSNDDKFALIKEVERVFDVSISEVTIIKNDGKFFGMRIVPDVQGTRAISNVVFNDNPVKDKFQLTNPNRNNNKKMKHMQYILEIDSKLLWDKRIRTKPKEAVAVLLHEIGHVCGDYSINYRLRVAYLDIKNSYGNKAKVFRKMINSDPLRDVLVLHSYYNRKVEKVLDDEKVADKFVIQSGYGTYLNDYVDRLVDLSHLDLQSKARHHRSDLEQFEDDKVIVGWGIETVSSMSKRRRAIAEELDTAMKNEQKGTCLYNALTRARDRVKNMKTDKMEIYDRVYEEALTEGLHLNIFGRKAVNYQRIIDELVIDSQDIRDYEEKSYIVDRIHSRLDDIEIAMKNAKKLKNTDPRDYEYQVDMLNDYRKQLLDLRKTVMALKIREKRYGVLVKSPVGYEG